jgi:hypothetical protein
MSHHDEQDGEFVEEFRAVAELAEAFTSLVDHLTARRTVALDLETLVTFAHRMMPRTTHTGVIVQVVRSRGTASSPVMSGISRSQTMASGQRRPTSSTASRPFDAVPSRRSWSSSSTRQLST